MLVVLKFTSLPVYQSTSLPVYQSTSLPVKNKLLDNFLNFFITSISL